MPDYTVFLFVRGSAITIVNAPSADEACEIAAHVDPLSLEVTPTDFDVEGWESEVDE